MAPERWQQIGKLLEQALEQEPVRRNLFLDDACGGDEELRQEVEALLVAHDQAGSLMSAPALGVGTRKPANSLQPLIGQNLGHYQILSRLGEGGMGIVYKARDRHLDRFVAIKVLTSTLVTDPDRKRRFVQEAKAASALNHPNIITVHDIASENGRDFIVMEYVDGKTLDQLILRVGLKLKEVLNYGTQIADALAKAHAAGIVHRDLKPGNIMVDANGQVKVVDFGLARFARKASASEVSNLDAQQTVSQTKEGAVLGTISYMSPEQAEGKAVDARSDIFSFGAVLYEMMTGQRAFQGDSQLARLTAILREDPKPAGQVVRGVPPELDRIIERCLRKDPEGRFQSAADLKVALQELKDVSGSDSLRTAEVAALSWKLGRFSAVMWTALALAAVGLGAAVWFWLGRSDKVQPEVSLTALPLTSYPGAEMFPSFSPDGNQVAFSWDGETRENLDIYVKVIGTESPLRLTKHPGDDYSPAWSPDGRFIAFQRGLGKGKAALILISALGGPERQLAEIGTSWTSDFRSSNVGWYPDGKWIAVPDRESPGEPLGLFLVSVESGKKQKLTNPPGKLLEDTGPSFSPDGRALVFSRFAGGSQSDIYLLALSANLIAIGQPKRLTFANQSASSPVWMPDGNEIIFSSGPQHRVSLWRIGASQANAPKRLPFVADGAFMPAISRQGHRLAYMQRITDINIWRIELPGEDGEASPPTKLIASTRLSHLPQFSPDGKRIAFASYRSGNPEVWVCDADGSNALQLTSFGGPETPATPRWSPDGLRIVLSSNWEGQQDIYLIGSQGGKLQRLTSDPANDGSPSWSRDGKSIYFSSNRSGEVQIWKMPAEGGGAVQVTQKGGHSASESPERKFVYYTKDGKEITSLWRVPVEGGEETQVLQSIYAENFAVVNRGIYFVSNPESTDGFAIQFFEFATGETKRLASIQKTVLWGFDVSPDERWILYTQFDNTSNDLMLVENFR